MSITVRGMSIPSFEIQLRLDLRTKRVGVARTPTLGMRDVAYSVTKGVP